MAGRTFTINFDTGIEKVEYSTSLNQFPTGEATTSGQTVAGLTDFYVRPIFKQGYELDSTNVTPTGTNGIYSCMKDGVLIKNVTFTSKQSTPQPTLTFKHFYDAGTIGSGTVKFRHYSQQEPTPPSPAYTDCLTFIGETSDFTLAIGSGGAKEWDGTVEYSTDHNTWTRWNGTAALSVDKKLYLRGSGNTKFWTSNGAQLSLSARAACSGNLNTLLEYSNPPTTLADFCYKNMFYGCTSLTQAPELPATTLARSCYLSMFSGCTSLTQAPTLPATTLADSCYDHMFSDCTSLKISSTQSSEYPTAWRIPSSGTISSEVSGWNAYMLMNTGGTFKSNPSINTTYYGAW